MRTQPRVTEIACRVLALSALIGILFVIGCAGGGTQSSNPPPVTYTVGGTVSGLFGRGLYCRTTAATTCPSAQTEQLHVHHGHRQRWRL